MFTRLLYAMQGNRDQIGSGKRTSEVSPGELEGRKLLSKLSKFVADSDLSIYRIAQLMGVSGRTLKTWISGAAKPRRDKLLEIRSPFLICTDLNASLVLTSVHKGMHK
jgi:hypothetical protein